MVGVINLVLERLTTGCGLTKAQAAPMSSCETRSLKVCTVRTIRLVTSMMGSSHSPVVGTWATVGRFTPPTTTTGWVQYGQAAVYKQPWLALQRYSVLLLVAYFRLWPASRSCLTTDCVSALIRCTVSFLCWRVHQHAAIVGLLVSQGCLQLETSTLWVQLWVQISPSKYLEIVCDVPVQSGPKYSLGIQSRIPRKSDVSDQAKTVLM